MAGARTVSPVGKRFVGHAEEIMAIVIDVLFLFE